MSDDADDRAVVEIGLASPQTLGDLLRFVDVVTTLGVPLASPVIARPDRLTVRAWLDRAKPAPTLRERDPRTGRFVKATASVRAVS